MRLFVTTRQERLIEKRGVLKLMLRFGGKAKTSKTGAEMAQRVFDEGTKIINKLGV